MNVYSFDGLLVLALLMICTCAYITKVPRLKSFFLSEKKGFFGVFYKAAVIGIRLHWIVALSCVLMSLYILVLK
ncbi:protein kish-B-like [Acropora palmata]|uniref:protein kish-B-like n=1 Tax=Acropora palmata TaxID=6131 RepID=UPI003143F2DE